jgi:hypothetical protein
MNGRRRRNLLTGKAWIGGRFAFIVGGQEWPTIEAIR